LTVASRAEGFFALSTTSQIIFQVSLDTFHLPFVGLFFVFVRVISWIVLHLSGKQAIHEVTRSITK